MDNAFHESIIRGLMLLGRTREQAIAEHLRCQEEYSRRRHEEAVREWMNYDPRKGMG